ncbi:MAG: MBL fold metallo-hydrolase, partial [Anaerolineae bacterium]
MVLRVHSIFGGIAVSHLIESDGGLVLVDAGLPGFERLILRRMAALGRDDLRLIFITHAHVDHYGSAAALRRLTGVPIAIHRDDADAMAQGETDLGSCRGFGRVIGPFLPVLEASVPLEPTQADVLVEDGSDLRPYGLDGMVIHTPGHTPGSSCLFVDGRLAFVSDLISAVFGVRGAIFFAQDWTQVPRNLARIQALEPEKIYVGHSLRP